MCARYAGGGDGVRWQITPKANARTIRDQVLLGALFHHVQRRTVSSDVAGHKVRELTVFLRFVNTILFPRSDRSQIVSVSEQAEQTSHAFPDRPILANWPYDDPTKVQGTPEQVEAAYFRVASRIRYRLQLFNNLSFDQLDRLRIEVKMKELAESN